jgi:galactokinase
MNTFTGPENFTDVPKLTEALAASGLRPAACRSKAECFAQAAGALAEMGIIPTCGFFVPGRIEVLGKHTDYAGGSSLVAAAERGFCLVAAPRSDNLVRMNDVAYGETIELILSPDLIPPIGSWTNYPMTVARRLCRNFPALQTGAEIALVSDLPPAAGMSSSSALMVATFFALAEVNQLFAQKEFPAELNDPLRLAEYLGTIENGQSYGSLTGDRGVGTFGGSEDHTAMLCSEAGRLGRFCYCPTQREGALPCPAGYLFAIASSGVKAEKTGAAMEKYNQASLLVSRLNEIWRKILNGSSDPSFQERFPTFMSLAKHVDQPLVLETLRQLPNQANLQPAQIRRSIFDMLRSALEKQVASPDERSALRDRLEHFVAENEEIIPAACEALSRNDIAEFGRQVDRSQHATEHLLKNQVPETVFLATEARKRGAAAASAFGAGFGGSVWALVEETQARRFLSDWSAAYAQTFPEPAARAQYLVTATSPAAFRMVPHG